MIDTINYHFTNVCNYSCKHCFVNKNIEELSLQDKLKVIDNVSNYFQSIHVKGRLNLVGGEPLMSPDIDKLIHYAYQQGMEVSLVTNGVLLNHEFIEANHSYLTMVGLSIDSLDTRINTLIGRCLVNRKVISESEWMEKINLLKKHNIKVKINVCLSKLNYHNEEMYRFLKTAQPDRLKILAMSITEGINDNSMDNLLSNQEVENWCHSILELNPVIEYSGQMHNAYVVINALGQLIVNDQGSEIIIKDLVEQPLVREDMSLIDEEKYARRYEG